MTPAALSSSFARRSGAARLGLAALAGLFSSCGPSFEAVAEGDLRFAHCDRLDLDPGIAPSHRLHCWREWRRIYTYGQTRDRVEYAQRRIAEVVSGDTDPAFDLPSGQPRPLLVTPAAAPGSAVVAESAPPSGATAPPPATEPKSCEELCASQHQQCLAQCSAQPQGCGVCPEISEACRRQCGSAQ